MGPEDLLVVPDNKFFRKRGMLEWVFQPYDVAGHLMAEGGKPIPPKKYQAYLKTVLPPKYLASEEFAKYCREADAHHDGGGW